LVKTSVGVVLVELDKGWGSHEIALFGDDGWETKDMTPNVDGEFEWNEEEIVKRLVELGVPAAEAHSVAEQTWAGWFARGGRPMTRREDVLGAAGVIAILLFVFGGWLIGAGVLVWLLIRLAF
jgi:hypothetical protein